MSRLKVKDGTEIYYKDWGSGKPVVFSHGWPLSADAWESQMLYLSKEGYRCIAHDRRGHGRSSQPTTGNDMNTYADDLAQLLNTLDLKEVTLAGHSAGGGEVARYIGRYGTSRVSKIILIGAVTPLRLKTPANPLGTPIEKFNETRNAVINDRAEFYKDLTTKFYGRNRKDNKVCQGICDAFWFRAMQGGLLNQVECIKAFSETDFTEDLKKFDVPTLLIHGDDDQIVPMEATSKLAVKLIKDASLAIISGGSHGLSDSHKDQLNSKIHDFLKAEILWMSRL
jgi:non-heme chloroperoxidase